jgi:hypothetical protein
MTEILKNRICIGESRYVEEDGRRKTEAGSRKTGNKLLKKSDE